MKEKMILIILCLSLLGGISGCSSFATANNVSNIEKITIENPHAHAATDEAYVEKVEALTDDDKNVKAEIAKHIETEVDFRYAKQQEYNGKSYALTFSKMGGKVANNLADRITYKNEEGDEFIYSTRTGALVITYLKSLEVPKNEDSITIESAHGIAEKFAKANCDFTQYKLVESKETKQGYAFNYCKYIHGYKTNDNVNIVVSFNGDIIWSAIGCNLIDNTKITVDKKWFEDKISESTTQNNAIFQDACIEIEDDGKLYFDIECIVGDSLDEGYPMIYRHDIPLR